MKGSRRGLAAGDGAPADESIVIVGVCGSGKSTLARGLRALGCPARACMQEHSYVPTLWRRRGRPRLLVYLEASLEVVCRRHDVQWPEEALAVQRARLAVARTHADLCIDTDGLTIEQVRQRVLDDWRASPRRAIT